MTDWSSLIGGLGIGSLIGGLVQNYVSAKLRHREWVKDNKKQEWRELIDALREALRVMMAHRYENFTDDLRPAEDVHHREEAIRKGYVAIGDRIFIVKKVRDSGMSARWDALSDEYQKVEASVPEGLNRFNSLVNNSRKFQDDLIQFSREDLGLD